jgi:hypothetical protein
MAEYVYKFNNINIYLRKKIFYHFQVSIFKLLNEIPKNILKVKLYVIPFIHSSSWDFLQT